MPCYNAVTHLPQSIGSVLAQTRKDWELIVVDDGSGDESWQTLQRLAAGDDRIRIFRQANAGAAAARNHGLAQTRGAYTAFLDSDDTWHAEFLATMSAALDENPQAGVAYCGWQNLGREGGSGQPYVPPDYETGDKIEAFLKTCPWPIHAAMIRSNVIRTHGGFDVNLSSCMDYDLWLRLGAEQRLVRVPRVLAYYHHHEGEQITRNRARLAINHWRAQQKFLQAHPSLLRHLGAPRLRELTDGELLDRGFACYWKRDLPAARRIFRMVMRRRYGSLRDWKYMLPAWLPEAWHRQLIRLLENSPEAR